MLYRISFYCLFFIIFISCETSSSLTNPTRQSNGPKNGEWITRRTDGSIKTRINYENGLKQGKSFLYYDDGKTVQLEMTYDKSKRTGTSIKYYDDSTPYAVTSYTNDLLHGERKTYYRNGELQSIITYQHGQPGIGLKEYYKSGNEIMTPTITWTRFGNTLKLGLDENCRNANFYIGSLTDDTFMPAVTDLELIPEISGVATIDLSRFTPSFLALQDVICQCKTEMGNPRVITKRILL